MEGYMDPRTIAVAEMMRGYEAAKTAPPVDPGLMHSWCRCEPPKGWGIYRHAEVDPELLVDAQVYALTDGVQ